MWIGLVFAFLGVFGSALPAHLGLRILAHREHLDRQLPFAAGTESNWLKYTWWLIRLGHRQFPQAQALQQFGNLAAIFGWITLLAMIGTVFCFFMSKAG
jgi:hypothetical protein